MIRSLHNPWLDSILCVVIYIPYLPGIKKSISEIYSLILWHEDDTKIDFILRTDVYTSCLQRWCQKMNQCNISGFHVLHL